MYVLGMDAPSLLKLDKDTPINGGTGPLYVWVGAHGKTRFFGPGGDAWTGSVSRKLRRMSR